MQQATNKESGMLEIRKNYLSAVLAGDIQKARTVIDECLHSGISPKSIYLYVFSAAQRKMGELWSEGKISIIEEHRASNITLNEMGRLRELLKPKAKLNKKALITCSQGDNHLIGAKIIADFLWIDGWDVEFLGVDTPTDSLIAHLKETTFDLVGLSVSTDQGIEVVKQTINKIRDEKIKIKIIIGGAAVRCDMKAEDFNADAICNNAQEVGDVARGLLGLPPASAYLEQYLKEIGTKISKYRRFKKLSQQQVADSSGLDRAYISAVEHGKHNLTIGALMKLSEALEISIEELLLEKTNTFSENILKKWGDEEVNGKLTYPENAVN